ncbi:MAG: hypothetical protein ABI630_00925, partial [Betaproteobacteria bacterium]
MNTGYAISDAVLATACIFIVVRAGGRPGVRLACATLGAAAMIGTMRFAGAEGLAGAHRFASLLGGVAALPLLAASIAWPEGKPATD